MQVDILTPDKTLYSGDAQVLTLPGTNGSFQVLEDHAPMIANLGVGVVRVKTDQKTEEFEVKGGLVEVLKNKIVVLV